MQLLAQGVRAAQRTTLGWARAAHTPSLCAHATTSDAALPRHTSNVPMLVALAQVGGWMVCRGLWIVYCVRVSFVGCGVLRCNR